MSSKIKSSQLIPLSFLCAILVGTILLMLPIATADGKGTGLLTALFTSTTSICVTGLVVVDTFSYWSLFGKMVILVLIQLGGLGIITITSVFILLFQKRFTLSQSIMLHDAFNLDSMEGLMKFLNGVVKGTLTVEFLGTLVYMPVFITQFGVLKGIWVSIFTAISAFCNAGIDIIGPNSLIDYNSNNLVLINTMFLIVMGGLGYVVWFDINNGIKEGIRKHHSPGLVLKRLKEHTKIVIRLTWILIAAGAIGIFIMEYSNPDTIGNMSLWDKIINSIFQSVTFRTAGFASVPQQSLTEGSCAVGALFMFVGGSPVGTAGGIKTVTFFMAIMNAVAFIRGRDENVIFGRKISSDLIRKSEAIIMVSFSVTFIMMLLIMITNNLGMIDAMYETFSATATVGLSRAVTPTLNRVGKLLIIICMYLGRIGPISMALFFDYGCSNKNNISFAKGRFFVG